MSAASDTPFWVNDYPFINRLLHRFLDMVDARKERLSLRVTKKNTPELFDFDGSDDPDFLWTLIDEQLCQEYQLLLIKPNSKLKANEPSYQQAMLTFQSSETNISRLRTWLDRPEKTAYSTQWQLALETAQHIENPKALSQPIKHHTKSASNIIDGFVSVGAQLRQQQRDNSQISLRSLSAQCFWGDSKFLDNRYTLVCTTYPQLQKHLEPRSILMDAFIPEQLKKVIFVENVDSFCLLAQALTAVIKQSDNSTNAAKHIGLIYSAGFKGSAERIREPGNSQFATLNTPSNTALEHFNQWWFKQTLTNIPCFFWGDLDYSGMAILNALKQPFPNTTCWQAGYELILAYHRDGLGHAPSDAKKQNQRAPSSTQCEYANSVLLPLLKDSLRFVDQEVVNKEQLITALRLEKTD